MAALQTSDSVLITGGTGWIGSHIAHEALAAGLKIRLAIRNEAKAKQLVEALEQLHGKGNIETVTVTDFVNEGAYFEAIKGMHGVVHAATDVSFSGNRDQVIDSTLRGYNTLLQAADAEKSVRRVVFTSSYIAVGSANTTAGSKTQHLDASMYNDAVVEESKVNPNPVNVYAASKVLSEKFTWDYIARHKPSFVVTSINPNVVLGAPVPRYTLSGTGAMLRDLVNGKRDVMLLSFGPTNPVDVDDVSRLHILALIREDVKAERILACGNGYTINQMIEVIRKVKPDSPIESKDEWNVEDNTIVDVARANELLKDQGGLHDLEYSVRRLIESQTSVIGST